VSPGAGLSPFEPPVLWVTGGHGLIGRYVCDQAERRWSRCRVLRIGRPGMELTDLDSVARRFSEERPSAVIHCAAMSRSPACQADPARARLHNVGVTRHLVSLCTGIPFVLLSTDLVFRGDRGGLDESARPDPISVYGETKVEAEEAVRGLSRHLIIRTSLNYGHSPTADRAFNEEMVQAWKSGRTLRLFTDEYRTPIAAAETARAVLDLLAMEVSGTLHVAGGERLSRWELGSLIAGRHPDLDTRREATSVRDYQGPPRAADVTLDCRRAERLLGRSLPRFSDWLRDFGPGD
jgi:dTDP-4-dehydrorhamnose reductase